MCYYRSAAVMGATTYKLRTRILIRFPCVTIVATVVTGVDTTTSAPTISTTYTNLVVDATSRIPMAYYRCHHCFWYSCNYNY
eukprot:2912381-Pyramimonas_sp.AAC.1